VKTVELKETSLRPREPLIATLLHCKGLALEVPNDMQMWGVPRSFGAEVNTFHLRQDENWEPDWEEFERAVNQNTRLVDERDPISCLYTGSGIP